MITSAEIITQKIIRATTRHIYYSGIIFEGLDNDYLFELIETLKGAMRDILTEADCWRISLACVNMWKNGTPTNTIFVSGVMTAYMEAN